MKSEYFFSLLIRRSAEVIHGKTQQVICSCLACSISCYNSFYALNIDNSHNPSLFNENVRHKMFLTGAKIVRQWKIERGIFSTQSKTGIHMTPLVLGPLIFLLPFSGDFFHSIRILPGLVIADRIIRIFLPVMKGSKGVKMRASMHAPELKGATSPSLRVRNPF